MILFVAAGAWLAALVVVSFASPLTLPARRQMQTDLAGIGVVIAATLGFFWRLVFTANVWIPAGGGDLAGFLYPTYQFAAEWWRRGVIPLWNPYLFAGQPFVGDIQSGIFYPLNLLTFLISSPFSYRDLELLSVLHYMIAGIGMYAFLRWGSFRGTTPFNLPSVEKKAEGQVAPSKPHLSRAACLAGALAFEFSDLFITHFGNLNLIAAAAWLPLVFLFFMRGVDQAIETRAQPPSRPLAEVPPRIRPAPSGANSSAGSGLAPVESRPGHSRLAVSWLAVNSITPSIVSGIFLAVAFLAGHIQSFLFILLALGMYAVYRVVESRRSALRVLAALGVTLVVGLGLSALVLVPSVEMSRASVRSSFTYEDAAQFSLPPAELVGLFVPGFFGRGPEAAWGPWPRVEVGYLGIFPLILAGLAVVLRWDSKTFFFILLALAGLILALGGYAIVHGWLYAFVPGFGQLRAPARFILLVDFGLAASAAIGFDTLVQPLTGSRQQTFHRIMRSAPWALLLVALASGSVAGSILILGQGQDPVLFHPVACPLDRPLESTARKSLKHTNLVRVRNRTCIFRPV